MLTWHVDNLFKIKKKIKNFKKILKKYEVTCDDHCSPSFNNLKGVYKNDQIDHNLQKWRPFWTFQKMRTKVNKIYENWNQWFI